MTAPKIVVLFAICLGSTQNGYGTDEVEDLARSYFVELISDGSHDEVH